MAWGVAADILLTIRRVGLLLPPSVPLHCRMRCGCCGGSCCGAAVQESCKIETVAVLRFYGEAKAMLRSIRTALRTPF
jgi:hypothetical protein